MRHPNKQIQAAIEHAESQGWTITKSRGHAWGRMRCGYGHGECQCSIWSTPKNPQNHARFLRRKVDQCPGPDEDGQGEADG